MFSHKHTPMAVIRSADTIRGKKIIAIASRSLLYETALIREDRQSRYNL
jgi:hypothetical protein